VAQIVEPDPWQTGPLENSAEVALGDVVGVERLAVGLAEDQAAILVRGPK
jgi:hypothetical protein